MSVMTVGNKPAVRQRLWGDDLYINLCLASWIVICGYDVSSSRPGLRQVNPRLSYYSDGTIAIGSTEVTKAGSAYHVHVRLKSGTMGLSVSTAAECSKNALEIQSSSLQQFLNYPVVIDICHICSTVVQSSEHINLHTSQQRECLPRQ